MITREQFCQFISHLKAAVPVGAPTFEDQNTLSIWYQPFKDCDIEDMRKAFAYCRDHEKFFPTIARLREVTGASSSRPTFDSLVALISRHGAYRPPEADPFVVRVINRLGGWKRVCEWTDAELPFRQKEFDQVVDDLKSVEAMGGFRGQPPPTLTGHHETAQAAQPNQKIIEPPKTDSTSSVDWDAIRKAHGDDLDMNVSAMAKEKGFFRLRSEPGYWFSYRNMLTPGRHIPYKFVDVADHMEDVRNRRQTSGIPPLDGTWDASRYDISRMP